VQKPKIQYKKVLNFSLCGDDAPKFEPKKQLNFAIIDKNIQQLRVYYKVHPEWFETPKPKSAKDKNEVVYSIE